MTPIQIHPPRSPETPKPSSARALRLGFLTGLLGVALFGCGRQPDPPARPRDGAGAKPAQRNFENPQRAVFSPDGRRVPTEQPQRLVEDGTARPLEPPVNATSQITRLPLYEIKMAAKDLTALERSTYSNETLPATFIADGEVYERVKIRYRGAWARSWPKKPLKIFFTDEKPFHGQHRLNLNSGWRDPAFVRETLAYHIYAVCGAPASKSHIVRVQLNGQFRGLYIEVEQPDKAFLNRLGLKGASVYKASSHANMADERDLGSEASYRSHYEKQTQKSEDYRDLQLFCQELALSKNTLDFFNRRVDVEKYINFLAAMTLVQNWDGYNKNHFLVYDGRGSKKWFPLPWDLDRTLGDHWNWSFDSADLPILLGTQQQPGVTGWNRLQDRFFSEPTLRARFVERLSELLEKEFTAEKLFPVLDQLESEIRADIALDRQRWPGQSGDLHAGIAQVKRFIERRRAYLLSEVSKLRRATPSR